MLSARDKPCDVFISHTGRDKAALDFAAHLKDKLDDQGIAAFFDAATVRVGDRWEDKIRSNVQHCRIFVAILSPNYFKRYWCMHELHIAISRRVCPILPVYYDMSGPGDLPSGKDAFLQQFREDKRLAEGEAEIWWENVHMLSKIQHLNRSTYPTKDGDVLLKKEIARNLRDLLGQVRTNPSLPTETPPNRSAETGPAKTKTRKIARPKQAGQKEAFSKILKGHRDIVRCCDVFGSGNKALSGGEDNALRVWDLSSGKAIVTMQGHTDHVYCCTFFDGGRKALSGSKDNTLKVWDLNTGKSTQTLLGHSDYVRCCAVFEDGRRAVSGSKDKTLRLWDLNTGNIVRTLRGHIDYVVCCAVFHNNTKILSGSTDNTLKVWSLATGETIQNLLGHTNSVYCCTVYDNSTKALSGGYDKILRVWNLATGQIIQTLKGHTNWVRCCMVFNSGAKALSGGGDNSLIVWDLSTGRIIQTLKGHTSGVRCCSVFDNGTKALSGSYDKNLALWCLDNGQAS